MSFHRSQQRCGDMGGILITLRHFPRDASRWIRRKTGTFGMATGRLDRNRPDKPLALRSEHISPSAKLFASRYDFMASLPKGGICTEVGVQNGNFSAYILDSVAPEKLHLIDLSFRKLRNPAVRGHPAVELHEGDSATVLGTFPDAYFDWIYIDAGHEYKDVRRDATVAAQKVKPEGLIIFNDYIIWSHHEGFAYGVVQTVNEMCVNEGWEIIAYCLHENLYCDVALRRRGHSLPRNPGT